MSARLVKMHYVLDDDTESRLQTAMSDMALSGCAYNKILKVARTIADLADSDDIKIEPFLPPHLASS